MSQSSNLKRRLMQAREMAEAMNRSKSHENIRAYSLNDKEESKKIPDHSLKNIQEIRKAIEDQQQ